MRALYGVKVMTVFVCGIFSSILSSRSKAFLDLHISGEYIWVEALKDFQVLVNEEVKRQFVNGKMTTTLKEIEAVKICASSLHDLISRASCKEKPVQDMNGINLEKKSIAPARMTDFRTEQLKHSISNLTNSASCNEEPAQNTSGINYDEEAIVTILADRVEGLGHELDYLRKQANDFFQIILAGLVDAIMKWHEQGGMVCGGLPFLWPQVFASSSVTAIIKAEVWKLERRPCAHMHPTCISFLVMGYAQSIKMLASMGRKTSRLLKSLISV
ncbi:hypothetical protein Cni_G14988 [Canna indica]|uniref:Uncharacterized protein n=1 Tax=Canna indica TaxID=4628 RepID=A0AAQ3QEC2_9LILI|nr:hypothetical protein Cni_G14988 [Canna indica]